MQYQIGYLAFSNVIRSTGWCSPVEAGNPSGRRHSRHVVPFVMKAKSWGGNLEANLPQVMFFVGHDSKGAGTKTQCNWMNASQKMYLIIMKTSCRLPSMNWISTNLQEIIRFNHTLSGNVYKTLQFRYLLRERRKCKLLNSDQSGYKIPMYWKKGRDSYDH